MEDAGLTAQQLAERLRVKEALIYDLARDGKIPSLRLGKRIVRFYWPDVLDALRRGEAGNLPVPRPAGDDAGAGTLSVAHQARVPGKMDGLDSLQTGDTEQTA